jgi:glycolate oxidase FAD binding subunit
VEVDARFIPRNGRSISVTAQIQERVREAGAARMPLRIKGRSGWLSAGRPVDATDSVSVAELSGVSDYVPGDLTITVRAGTTLADLARLTGEHGQWLPLNPFGSDSGSIGATVATGSSGPFSHGFGTIRDLVLGLEVVTGDAKIVRGGGRVVKNVAGFDLVRLMTGSWGTLGIITEVTLRLYALPAHRATIAMEAPTEPHRLAERFRGLLEAPIMPYALELVSEEVSRRIGLPPRPMILIEIGGNDAAVSSQKVALGKLGAVIEGPVDCWDKMRTMGNGESTVFRLSGLPAGLATRWNAAKRIVDEDNGAMMHASIGRGTVRCILSNDSSADAIAHLATSDPGNTLILETAPAALWTRLSPTAIPDRVSQSLSRAFDPFAILNPGILGTIN